MVEIKTSKAHNLKRSTYEYFLYYPPKYELMYLLLLWKYDIKIIMILQCQLHFGMIKVYLGWNNNCGKTYFRSI